MPLLVQVNPAFSQIQPRMPVHASQRGWTIQNGQRSSHPNQWYYRKTLQCAEGHVLFCFVSAASLVSVQACLKRKGGSHRAFRRIQNKTRMQSGTAVLSDNLQVPCHHYGDSADSILSLGEQVKADFPSLQMKAHGRMTLTYLDSAATSQKPKPMVDALEHYYAGAANVHRGAYELSASTTEAFEAARATVGQFIGATSPEEVIFTSGATEAINLVAASWGGKFLQTGDEIVLTVMEHHSNIVPWQLAAQKTGATIRYAQLTNDGELDLQHLKSLLTPRTKLVALTHVSNTLGCINPIHEVSTAAHQVGARVLLDACQSVPHIPINVAELGVDWIVGSGHKMCGPTGIGFLWGQLSLLREMPPWKGGGEMIKEVFLETSTFADVPARFEAGTPPIAQAIGLGAACKYLMHLDMRRIESYEKHLAEHLWNSLEAIEGLKLYGPPPRKGNRSALVAFNDTSDDVYPADVATLLDSDGFAIRSGHHCAQPLHRILGATYGSARASLAFYNTIQDIDRFVDSLKENLEMLRSGEGCMFDPDDPDSCYCGSQRMRS